MSDNVRDRPHIATLPPDLVDVDVRRVHRIRLVALVLLTTLVLAGLSGFLGVNTATVAASANGYAVHVRYPQIARGGLPADWDVQVRLPAGSRGPVTIAVPKDYLELFDMQGIFPEPVRQTSAPPYVLVTFDPPPAGALDVYFEASKTPALGDIGVQHAEVVVLAADEPMVRASYRTWVVV